jgi:hypothetical protein
MNASDIVYLSFTAPVLADLVHNVQCREPGRKLVVVENVMQPVEDPMQRQSLRWCERAEQIGLEAYGNRDDLVVDAPALAGERDLDQPAVAGIFGLFDDLGGLQTVVSD